MDTFIHVSQAKAEFLQAPNPPKDYKLPPPKKVEYSRLYFQYAYQTPQGSRLSDPLFELSKTTATIKKKANEDGRLDWKCNVRISNPGDIQGCNQLDIGVRHAVFKYKGKYKLNSFTVDNPGELRGIFFYPRDDTGTIIEGTNPLMSLKMDDKTSFKKMNFEFDESGQVIVDSETNLPKYTEEQIDYKTLENKSFECGIVFSVRDMYHNNGLPTPQLFVRTCWVLSAPTERGAVDSKQSSVLKDFLSSASSEQLNTLMAVVGQLKSGQASSLLESIASTPTQGLPGLPTPPAAQPSTTTSYPQLPPPGSTSAQPAPGSPQQHAPSIDLTAFMTPQQQAPASTPSYPQQMPPGYPQQMPSGYPQQFPTEYNQYLQSGMAGQPQVSATRL